MAESTRFEDGVWAVIESQSGNRYFGLVDKDDAPETVVTCETYELKTENIHIPTQQGMAIQRNSAMYPVDNCLHPVRIRHYNVSSITDNGTGDYTVNFTSALADANYAVTLTTVGAALGTTTRAFVVAGTDAGGATLKTTTQLRVQRGNSSAVGLIDAAELNVMVMR